MEPKPNRETRAEVEAQIQAQQQRMAERANAIEEEARSLGSVAQARVQQIKVKTEENLLLVGSGLVGGGLLLKLLLGGSEAPEGEATRVPRATPLAARVPQRSLTNDVVRRLSRAVEGRLHRGEPMEEALGTVLRRRAPVLFRQAPEPDAGTSASRWLLGLGLVALVGVGAVEVALRRLTGQSLLDLIRGFGAEPAASFDAPAQTAGVPTAAPTIDPNTETPVRPPDTGERSDTASRRHKPTADAHAADTDTPASPQNDH